MADVHIIDIDMEAGRTVFPNLALMKLAGYYKSQGLSIQLGAPLLFDNPEKIIAAQVFTDSNAGPYCTIDNILRKYPNADIGGTGSGEHSVKRLPIEIERNQFPYYDLYTEHAIHMERMGVKRQRLHYYYDYSIGYITRGCFRRCPFCVNRNSNGAEKCSDVETFVDTNRKYVYLIDDNFLSYSKWEPELKKLNECGKPFQFKQGLDIRLLTEHNATRLHESHYFGDYIFAFDNIKDKEIIVAKLIKWRSICDKGTKLYILTGFEPGIEDIFSLIERIDIVGSFSCRLFVMKHANFNVRICGTLH